MVNERTSVDNDGVALGPDHPHRQSAQLGFDAFRMLIDRLTRHNPLGPPVSDVASTILSGAIAAVASIAAECAGDQSNADEVLAALHRQVDVSRAEAIRRLAAGEA